jgi:UMF1 family MFS transporter
MTRKAWAWAFYDWANSSFPTVVSTFVIAAYFAQGIAADPASGQAQWGVMQSVAGFAIAFLSPLLGAVADAGGRRRLMLGLCTLLTALFTALIWFAKPDPSYALYALVCVGLATIAFELGTVFYNAMLPSVALPAQLGRVSGFGWGLGYAGGLACLALCLVLLVQPNPSPLGLDRGAAEHVRATALLTAAWLLVFGWPVLLAVPDPGGPRPSLTESAARGLRDIGELLRSLPQKPRLARFVLARLFYTDGLNTLFAFGAIYAAGVFGMGIDRILLFGIAMNVTAGAGAAGFALVEDRLGARQTVLLALAAMIVLGTGLLLATTEFWFWVLALSLGLFFGPAQAASRSFMARLSPPDEIATHFGLFALSGRITGFIGPAVLAMVTVATGSQQLGMATVLVFLSVGALILLTVEDPPPA